MTPLLLEGEEGTYVSYLEGQVVTQAMEAPRKRLRMDYCTARLLQEEAVCQNGESATWQNENLAL